MPQVNLLLNAGMEDHNELVTTKSKTTVFKSLNKQAPQYICDLFTRNS